MTLLRQTLFILLLISVGCTSQMIVKPLQKGQQQVSANLGGPLIKLGEATLPIPLSSLNYANGLTENLTAFGGLQVTSLLYKNLHVNTGVTYGILKPEGWIPGLSASLSGNIISDFRESNTAFYPQLDVNAYWDYGKNHFMYLGSTNWIELRGTKSHSQEQAERWLTGIQFGNTFVKNTWNFTIESKWLAPTRNTQNLTVNYKTYSVNGNPKGAVGVYLGIAKQF